MRAFALLPFLIGCLLVPWSFANGAAGISLLVPSSSLGLAGDKELGLIVDQYNRDKASKPEEKILLVRRGEEFSTLREFMSRHLAGDTPTLAAIDPAELPAMGAASRLLVPPPEKLRKRVAELDAGGPKSRALAFQRAIPVLVVNQDHAAIGSGPLPSSWSALTQLAEKVARLGAQSESRALALPLQGSRGLWLLEALSGKRLWTREPGGLKTNRALASAVASLQALFSESRSLAVPDQSFDQALKSFIDGKTPILVASLDALPSIASQAAFHWAAGPLPRLESGIANLQTGNSLVVTRDDPAVWKFLDYLYSADVAGRWAASAGLLPVAPDVQLAVSWRKLASIPRNGASQRATDEDVLRARSEWIQALHLLFGEASRRVPFQDIATQLDSKLARSH